MRRSFATLGLVVVALLASAACGAPSPPSPPQAVAPAPRPLRILLVDDDGWDAPGIVAVRQALVAAGHTVTEVAPDGGESGTGAALTATGTLAVTPRGPGVWSVAGRPADAALVGLRSVLAGSPPDLVVSGINSAYNAAATGVHSGTVGAALTAAEFGTPALAVSTQAGGPADYAPSADYTARLVGALSARPAPLLPAGTVLNVNYPRGRDRAAGVVASDVAPVPQLLLDYTPAGPGQVAVAVRPTTQAPAGTDLAALARRQVSISALGVGFAVDAGARDAAVAAAAATGP